MTWCVMAEELTQLPFSDEAEKSVLGSILISPRAAEKAMERLLPDDFFRLPNRDIFTAMKQIWDRGGVIDVVTLLDALEKLGKTQSSGGLDYLTELSIFTPTAANAEHYIGIVEAASIRRRLVKVSTEIAQSAAEGRADAQQLLNDAERKVYEIAMRTSEDTMELIAPVYSRVFRRIGQLMQLDGQNTGLPTGLIDLDRVTSGLQRSDLIIIAGRPASGKTSLALNIAAHAALHENATVAVFSLEMSKEQLVTRIMSTESGVEMQKIRTGTVTAEELLKIAFDYNSIGNAQLLLDDTSTISVAEIRSRCRRIKARQGLDLVVIDYLQLMQSGAKSDSRVQAISEMTRGLKVVARELDVPIILLSQLSRKADDRPDHKPFMSDLRESGSIEQDADLIMMLHRPAAYIDTEEYRTNDNTTYLNIVKHRNGATCEIKLMWLPELTKFANYIDEDSIPGM